MATQQEHRTSPASSRTRGALRPGSYQVGESVGRVSAVLNEGGHKRSTPVSSEPLHVDFGGATALGRRGSNEDQYTGTRVHVGSQQSELEASEGDLVVAVADGMGGQPSGSIASRVAVEVFVEKVRTDFPLSKSGSMSPLSLQQFGDAAVRACQRELASELERSGSDSLPGSTLTAGVISGHYLYLFHVGDSRCYLLRGLELQQLTQDHTIYAEIIRAGLPSDGAPPSSRQLLRAGSKVDTSVVRLKKGDTILFCTDGVTGPLSHEAVHAVLTNSSSESARHVAERLIEQALIYGGTDNATAVVVKV